MSTSPLGRLVDFGLAITASEEPIDTVLVRDGIANGLLHLADEHAQVRVAWGVQSALIGGNAYLATVASPAVGVLHLIRSFGPWPLRLRHDGAPYRLRLRVYGRRVGGAGTINLHVAVSPARISLSAAADERSDLTWVSASVATDTSAALTGATTRSTLTTYLDATPLDIRGWVQHEATTDADGDPVSVAVIPVCASVYGITTSTASQPALTGLYLAEYGGDA